LSYFYNGGDNLLSGIEFTNGEELLIKFSQSLALANWEILIDEIIASGSVLLKGTDNAHDCYILASYNSNYFYLQGDLDGTLLNLSPTLELEFNIAAPNHFWLACNQGAGAIAIKRKHNYSGGVSFGFLERFDKSDPFAWMMAKINNKLTDAYVAKAKHNDTIWHCLGDWFANADNIISSEQNGAYQGILDLQTVTHPYLSYVNTNLRNAGYRAELGQLSTEDLLIFSKRFYLEGRGAEDNYLTEDETPPQLYNRGFVQFVRNGAGKVAGGRKELDEQGNIWLSTGDNINGWQAIQISLGINTQASLPTIFRPQEGIAFLNQTNLLDEVRNTLENAGWTTVRANTSRLMLRAQYSNSSIYCFFRIEVKNNNEIHLQANSSIEESNLSPPIIFTFTEESLNRVWISANKQTFAIALLDGQSNAQGGAWMGFFKDLEGYWGIGKISSDARESYQLKNNVWQSLGAPYTYVYNDFGSFPITTHDFLTTAGLPILNFENPDPRNSGYFAYKGQINGATDSPRLNYFGFLIGLNSALSYGLSNQGNGNAPKFPRFALVEFVATGAASLPAGQIINQDTATYRSVGETGYQAMRIS